MGPLICLFLLYVLYVMTFRVLYIDYSSSRIFSFSFIDIVHGFKCLNKTNKQTKKKCIQISFLHLRTLPVLLWMVLTVVADVRGGEDGNSSSGLPPSPSSSPAQPWSIALT